MMIHSEAHRMLASLAHRDRVAEQMDDPTLDPIAHQQALAGLARLNALGGSFRRMWRPIARLARQTPGRPLRVLDVATGAGEFPIAVLRWAKRAGLPMEAAGCDRSETALACGREAAAAAGVSVAFHRRDVLTDPLPGDFDVVTSNLFLHHLAEEDVVRLLTAMKAAGRRVVINDLDRTRLNYLLVWIGSRVLTRSPVVRFDGPASVRSALTMPEIAVLAERAGLTTAKVRRGFPAQFLLTWERT